MSFKELEVEDEQIEKICHTMRDIRGKS
jgi:hypothetical protein